MVNPPAPYHLDPPDQVILHILSAVHDVHAEVLRTGKS